MTLVINKARLVGAREEGSQTFAPNPRPVPSPTCSDCMCIYNYLDIHISIFHLFIYMICKDCCGFMGIIWELYGNFITRVV